MLNPKGVRLLEEMLIVSLRVSLPVPVLAIYTSFFSSEDDSFKPHVLIILGVIFSSPVALVGKALLQKLIERTKLKRKYLFNRLRRRRSQTRGVSPVIVSPWGQSTEPKTLSAAAPIASNNPSSESSTKGEWLPSNGSGRSLTFDTLATRSNQGSVNIVIGKYEPEIALL